MAPVFGRYGTGPLSFGATFWNPGAKTQRTAKKWRKNEPKWARYGLLKRVRAQVGYHWKLNGEWLYLQGYGEDAVYPDTLREPTDKVGLTIQFHSNCVILHL